MKLRAGSNLIPVILLLSLLLASLHIMSNANEQSTSPFIYVWLALFNVACMVILFGLISFNLYRLIVQLRAGVAGSRLVVRMIVLFVLLAGGPVSIVYYYSLQFLQRSIDSWFDAGIDQALEDSLRLSKASLDILIRERLKQTKQVAVSLRQVEASELASRLEELRIQYNAIELTLLSFKGHIIAFSSANPAILVPILPSRDILLSPPEGGNYAGLEPGSEATLHIRIVLRSKSRPSFVLTGLFPNPEHINSLGIKVQNATQHYFEVAYLRKELRVYLSITLSMVLLASLLAAVWAAFYSARRLVQPIRDLAEGTRAVADGNYDHHLPIKPKDELGFLVQSFNDMTRHIAMARDQAKKSQQQVKEQKTYLETVLGQLSSGILAVDMECHLRTYNLAADRILHVNLAEYVQKPLVELGQHYPHCESLLQELSSHIFGPGPEWRGELSFLGPSGRQILMCRSTPLRSGVDGVQCGHVVVLDDISALIQAQRDAAWGEVARRLAHEIKNPLTPIQLAAERMRHKCLPVVTDKAHQVLDRSTQTIVQQVKNMKRMVDAFSEYARAPHLQLQEVDLNLTIGGILELYKGGRAQLQANLDPQLPPLQADAGSISQVLHNLIKNALEAIPKNQTAVLQIATCYEKHLGASRAKLQIKDNGPGIPPEIVERVFEPYVTSKTKGTGLGLAIVKRIIVEHGGSISLENRREGGTVVKVYLPVTSAMQHEKTTEKQVPS